MTVQGKIIKGIAGFYYVHVKHQGIYECKARGIFRNKKVKPLIGDDVSIDILDEHEKLGNILTILPRKNQLIRPTVSNIGQVIIVFAINHPKPNLNLLDKFLVMAEKEAIHALVCFNKIDQVESEDEVALLKDIYEKAGYTVFMTSAKHNRGINTLEEALRGKTSVFAGPSGVGKSSLLNSIQSEVDLEIGEISEKIKRGKHTTRHAQLICFEDNSYVVDTPGFSSLSIDAIDKDDLKHYFIEFNDFEGQCRFHGCNHLSEPECAVKDALMSNRISKSRYRSYEDIYNELKDIRRKW